MASAIFFCFGVSLAVWAKAFRDAQLFLRSKISFADWMAGGQWMRTQGYVSLIKWEGAAVMGFGFFLLQWHLRHCG